MENFAYKLQTNVILKAGGTLVHKYQLTHTGAWSPTFHSHSGPSHISVSEMGGWLSQKKTHVRMQADPESYHSSTDELL